MIYPSNNEKYFFEINKYKEFLSDTYYDYLFYFYLIDEEGIIYLESCSYTQKTNCLKGIKSVIRNSKNRERFIIEQPFDNAWRVYLKAENGKKIANSPCFDNEEEAINFIEDLKNVSLKIPVIDNTKIKN